MTVYTAAPKTYGEVAAIPVTVENNRCLVVEPPGLPANAPLVLILHGLGTNAGDLVSLCDELHLPPCRFVLPDAPLVLSGYSPDEKAWYDLHTNLRSDFDNSRDYIFKILERFAHDTPKPRTVVFVGFSQGGVMSLEAGLNYKGKVLAVVCMSGYIYDPSQTLAHPLLPRKTPILMTHGTFDTRVSEAMTQSTWEALQKAGYHPVLKEYSTSHHITKETLDDVSAFLNSVLAVKSGKSFQIK